MTASDAAKHTNDAVPAPGADHGRAMASLMGLAIFGEKVAARTYVAMAEARAEHAELLRKFAAMEARHGASFLHASRANGVEPDRDFADRELGYLIEQVDRYSAERDFDALAILQGFIVESLAIATYEPFLEIDHRIVQREARPLSQAAKMFLQFLRDRRRELSRLVA